MSIDIKHVPGHYELYVNGQFYGSYDSITEALRDLPEADHNRAD